MSYAIRHTNVVICWKDRFPGNEPSCFAAITKRIAKAAEERAGRGGGARRRAGVDIRPGGSSGERDLAQKPKRNVEGPRQQIRWFQLVPHARHTPWGLELYCPDCSNKSASGGPLMGAHPRFTLHISEKPEHFKVQCRECHLLTTLHRPTFWMYESDGLILLAYPQPALGLKWGKKQKSEQSGRGYTGAAKRKREGDIV